MVGLGGEPAASAAAAPSPLPRWRPGGLGSGVTAGPVQQVTAMRDKTQWVSKLVSVRVPVVSRSVGMDGRKTHFRTVTVSAGALHRSLGPRKSG